MSNAYFESTPPVWRMYILQAEEMMKLDDAEFLQYHAKRLRAALLKTNRRKKQKRSLCGYRRKR